MNLERHEELVSVVISVYNRAAYIEECLNSIANQSYEKIEIIVVDDASTDHSAETVQSWIALHPNAEVVFVKLPRNVGFSGAVTTGLFLARGKYIAIQDSDDLSHRDRIKKQVEYLRQHPEITLVGTNYSVINDQSQLTKDWVGWLSFGSENIKANYNKGYHCISHGTILYRASLFNNMGGLNRSVGGTAEDYEFIMRCHRNGTRMDNLKDVLYYYRGHAEQRSRQARS